MLNKIAEVLEYKYYTFKMNQALKKCHKARGMEATYQYNKYIHYSNLIAEMEVVA